MAVPVYQPQKKTSYTPAKTSNKAGKFGAIAGSLIGATIGTLAVPGAGTAAGATAGAALAGPSIGALAGGGLGGAGSGAGLGSLIGGMVDEKKSMAERYTNETVPTQVESAGQRRLDAIGPDSLSLLGQGLQSVGRMQDPEITQQAGPPLFQAYMAEFNKRRRV